MNMDEDADHFGESAGHTGQLEFCFSKKITQPAAHTANPVPHTCGASSRAELFPSFTS